MQNSLYAIKTDYGYGLFQKYSKTSLLFYAPFYLIYYKQIQDIENFDMNDVLSEGYYYQRLIDGDFRINLLKDESIGKNHIVSEIHELNEKNILHIGEVELPKNVILPKLTREVDYQYKTGKYRWVIIDEQSGIGSEFKVNGKVKTFSKLNKEIALLSDFYSISFLDLIDRFNRNFKFADFNDDYVINKMEERYILEPAIRPVKKNLKK